MKDLKKEYDAFGPWIIKIKNQDEIPALFDKHIRYNKASDTYKVPRNVTRREARPGDKLYKSIISFDERKLAFLKSTNDLVTQQIIEYRNIESIQNRVDLLNGTLVIESKSEKVQIPYNAVSSDLIIEIVFKLRKNYVKFFDEIDHKIIHKDYTLPKNYFYKGILSKMKNKEEVYVIDAQETIEIIKQEKKWYDYLLDLYNPMIFQKIMFLTNHKELIIISRKDGIKRKRSADYSHIHTYIPLINIKDISHSESKVYDNLYTLSLQLNSNLYNFYVKRIVENIIK
jgi:hypothetical protein